MPVQLALPMLEGGATYEWSVVAFKGATESDPSETWEFTALNNAPHAPELVSPADGATYTASGPVTLQWLQSYGTTDDEFDVVSYTVFVTNAADVELTQISVNMTGGTGDLQSTTILKTLIDQWLVDYTSFKWHVVAHDVDGASSPSSATREFHFETLPAKPTLAFPTNGSSVSKMNVQLQWNAADRATSYQAHWGSTAGSDSFITSNTFHTIQNSLQGGATYAWYVTAINAQGSVDSDHWEFNATNLPPFQPIISNPQDEVTLTRSSVVANGALLQWTCSDPEGDILNYEVTVRLDNPAAVAQTFVVTEPQLLLSWSYLLGKIMTATLPDDLRFEWSVIAVDTDGARSLPGANSPWHFFIENNAPVLSNLSPVNGSSDLVTTPATLGWTATDHEGDAVTHHLYFGASGVTGGIPLVATFPNMPSGVPMTWVTPTLSSFTQYEWRVVSTDRFGASVASGSMYFKTYSKLYDITKQPTRKASGKLQAIRANVYALCASKPGNILANAADIKKVFLNFKNYSLSADVQLTPNTLEGVLSFNAKAPLGLWQLDTAIVQNYAHQTMTLTRADFGTHNDFMLSF